MPTERKKTKKVNSIARQGRWKQLNREIRPLTTEGDTVIRSICSKTIQTHCFPDAMVRDVRGNEVTDKYLKLNPIILHVGTNDVCRQQSEVLKQDFIELFNCLDKVEASLCLQCISGSSQQRDQHVQQTSQDSTLGSTKPLVGKGINSIES